MTEKLNGHDPLKEPVPLKPISETLREPVALDTPAKLSEITPLSQPTELKKPVDLSQPVGLREPDALNVTLETPKAVIDAMIEDVRNQVGDKAAGQLKKEIASKLRGQRIAGIRDKIKGLF